MAQSAKFGFGQQKEKKKKEKSHFFVEQCSI